MDWPGLMRVGLHRLRLPPAVFWALTPAELQIMLGLAQGIAPLPRARLDALLRDFPDQPKETDSGRD